MSYILLFVLLILSYLLGSIQGSFISSKYIYKDDKYLETGRNIRVYTLLLGKEFGLLSSMELKSLFQFFYYLSWPLSYL